MDIFILKFTPVMTKDIIICGILFIKNCILNK